MPHSYGLRAGTRVRFDSLCDTRLFSYSEDNLDQLDTPLGRREDKC